MNPLGVSQTRLPAVSKPDTTGKKYERKVMTLENRITDLAVKAQKGSFSLMEVLKDRLGNLGIPVIYGLSFGHVVDKFTLPVGVKAELNTNTKELKLLEPAVI